MEKSGGKEREGDWGRGGAEEGNWPMNVLSESNTFFFFPWLRVFTFW